jgi:hypothetical protein
MKHKKHTIEYKENGNIVFSYEITKYKDKIRWFLVPAIALISLFLLEFIATRTAYSLIIVFPLLFYFFYRWVQKTEKINGAEERQIIFKNLNPIINKDIASFEGTIKELERKYIIKESEPSIESRYVLILLSNGNELKYNIINAKRYDKVQVLEIDINAIKIE